MPEQDQILKIVASHTSLKKPEEVRLEHRLREDLGFDELDMIETYLHVEEDLDVDLDDTALEEVRTVQHLIDLVKRTRPAELEVLTPAQAPDILSPVELDELERIATAALPRSWDEHQEWRDEAGYNNGGVPTRFFYVPQHNGGAKVEMIAEVSEHLVAFQPKTVLKLIAAARKASGV